MVKAINIRSALFVALATISILTGSLLSGSNRADAATWGEGHAWHESGPYTPSRFHLEWRDRPPADGHCVYIGIYDNNTWNQVGSTTTECNYNWKTANWNLPSGKNSCQYDVRLRRTGGGAYETLWNGWC